MSSSTPTALKDIVSRQHTMSSSPLPALDFPGVDLPMPGAAAPRPVAADDQLVELAATANTVVEQPLSLVAYLDSQHRVRCADLIAKLQWTPETVLVGLTDQHAPLAWIQAMPRPCPHDDCRHEHLPEQLPGSPTSLPAVSKRSKSASRQCRIYSDARRLRLPPGLCHWVGTRAQDDVLLVAHPNLDAVLVTSPASISAALLALSTAAHRSRTEAPNNVTDLASRRSSA
jgi:hypothetical protein